MQTFFLPNKAPFFYQYSGENTNIKNSSYFFEESQENHTHFKKLFQKMITENQRPDCFISADTEENGAIKLAEDPKQNQKDSKF